MFRNTPTKELNQRTNGMRQPILQVDRLSVKYGLHTIVDDLSFSVEEGQWLMIVGPNGAGKTTVINAISQGIPYQGEVFFQGDNLRNCKRKELARKIGVLSQNHYVGYDFSVEEVIRLGRYAHAPGMFERGKDKSEALVQRAIELTGMQKYLKQSVLTLSGGELQRTFLAQLLTQSPRMLLLDEPTNHLDLVYQKQIFSLVKEWIRENGGAVVSVVHDLSLAKAYGTHAVLLQDGRLMETGPIDAVMTKENMERVYRMDVYEWMRKMYGQWSEEETV
ncbi:MAG: ABC transporter ATP-binding protein [Blautia sp.]|nr:ABC transporter ATP-binding protein [Blautia sp.]